MYLFQITAITPQSTVFNDSNTLVPVLAARILLYAIPLAGLIFFVMLLVAGFNFLTSAGDTAKIDSAKKGLTNGGIGLALVIVAYFLTQIIQAVFGLNIL
jgi:hypothetical protein